MADRCIFHIDCNSFFASVSLLYKPWLQGYPVAVGGDEAARHGIVLAKNTAAKACGVKTGMALWQARQLCPGLRFIPPDYDLYVRFSADIKQYFSQYTNLQESFGSDESWLDVTGTAPLFGGPEALAQKILADIPREFGITVSIGVSWNKIFAKLGSDYKKPNAITTITRTGPADTRWQEIVYPLPVEDLLYVGRATRARLHAKGVHTIGELAGVGERYLLEWFGKVGGALYTFSTGQDASPVSAEGAAPAIVTIGNSSTTPRDLVNDTDVKRLIYVLAETTGRRMREHGVRANTIGIWVRGTDLASFVRQRRLPHPTNLNGELAEAAFALFRDSYGWEKPLRSLGIRGSRLTLDSDPWQCELGVDMKKWERRQQLEAAIDGVNKRFGKTCLRPAVSVIDPTLEGMGTKESQEFAPTSYFR